jgi:uncharacterized alpha-E superfamily protein
MLARDAENLYWMARYLERAENTSRLILKITDSLLDMPTNASIGWQTILQIVGVDHLYNEHYKTAKENDIMHFLIADERNPSSILACIKYARENSRTLRELLPEDLWERVNSLYLYIASNIEDTSMKRRKKYIFLQDIITQRQAIIGLISGTMERSLPYYFMKIGRNLERADMTTRIIDVNYAISLPEDDPLYEVATESLWASILKSLSAFQTYRRLKNFHVNMPDVVDFFFNEQRFPRSIVHCLGEVESCLFDMPNSDESIKAVKHAKKSFNKKNNQKMNVEKLHECIDATQLHLGDIHNALNKQYFRIFDTD